MPQLTQRNSQDMLESGHRERITHCLAFQLLRRFAHPPGE